MSILIYSTIGFILMQLVYQIRLLILDLLYDLLNEIFNLGLIQTFKITHLLKLLLINILCL